MTSSQRTFVYGASCFLWRPNYSFTYGAGVQADELPAACCLLLLTRLTRLPAAKPCQVLQVAHFNVAVRSGEATMRNVRTKQKWGQRGFAKDIDLIDSPDRDGLPLAV